MNLRLIIEHAPHPQPRPEIRHPGGDLTIGRGADCDWQIEDPDMFVSRRHCIVTVRDGRCEVTDASRGGLFVDGSDAPLGAGNTMPLEHGMRLRLGDVVIRAELQSSTQPPLKPETVQPKKSALDGDDFFSLKETPKSVAPRPASLPEPFESGRPDTATPREAEARRTPPPSFDDPFTLDPVSQTRQTDNSAAQDDPEDLGFGSFFDDPPAAPTRSEPDPAPLEEPAPKTRRDETRDIPAPQPAATPSGDMAAFMRGLGVDPASLPASGADDLEALGRRFRLLVDGLTHLLRTRAKEKGSVRVAQTVIGSADVNPLKFLATTEDVLSALIAPRGRGYLDPDDAITGAYRDLSDHQMRTWIALQAALRQMIDRFDPAEFEREVEKAGLMKSLLSGGRNARLWQLYSDRYREIARSAEDRFLGEVGADFRDAYEGKRHEEDDR